MSIYNGVYYDRRNGRLRHHTLPLHMEDGLKKIKTIKTTTALASSDINKDFNVNLRDGNVTVTLPSLTLWSESDIITLIIGDSNLNHSNCLIIEGIDKDEMPDCWKDGMYEENSWIIIRKSDKYGGCLYVTDYYSPEEQLWDPSFGDIAW